MGHGIPQTKKPGTQRYYPPESKPLILCGACLIAVLQSSEKPRDIFNQIVESYRLPDIHAAFNKVRLELGYDEPQRMLKESIEDLKIRRSEEKYQSKLLLPDADFFKAFKDNASGKYSHLFEQWLDLKGQEILSTDFRYWCGLTDELIRVGFNNASEQAAGVYKLTAATSPRLVLAIWIRSLAEHNRIELVNDEETTAIRIAGTTYDLPRFLADKGTTREHRLWTKAWRAARYCSQRDDTIPRIAAKWYMSRVVYSGPTEFCRKMLWEHDQYFEPSNVNNDIKECDDAIGYPRGQ